MSALEWTFHACYVNLQRHRRSVHNFTQQVAFAHHDKVEAQPLSAAAAKESAVVPVAPRAGRVARAKFAASTVAGAVPAVVGAQPSVARDVPAAVDPGRTDFKDFHTFVEQAGPGDQLHQQPFIKGAISKVQQTKDRLHTMKCVQCHRGEIVDRAVRPVNETYLCPFCKRDRNCDILFYSHANHTVGSDFTLFAYFIS